MSGVVNEEFIRGVGGEVRQVGRVLFWGEALFPVADYG